MLFRIIYASRATRFYDHAEMREMCDVASRRNREDAITGLFLYDGTRFLQALEGERDVVEATMTRIAADHRHCDIVYSCHDVVPRREFMDWSMQIPFGSADDASAFVERVKDDVKLVGDMKLQAQFIGFAKLATTARNRL